MIFYLFKRQEDDQEIDRRERSFSNFMVVVFNWKNSFF